MSEKKDCKWMVRVSCMTFNHAPYIVDAMNGFTMQRTVFPFVCTIIDDASTDGEQEIIKNYLNEHFDLEDTNVVRHEETNDYLLTFARHKSNCNCYFAVLYLKYNHYSLKKPKLPYIVEWNDNAKYIAKCEGDDYWIDSHKLQIQIDYMEKHPYISFSCTRCKQLNQKNGEIKVLPNYYFDSDLNKEKKIFEFSRNDAFSHTWFTKNLTVLYRRCCVDLSYHRNFKYYRDVHIVYMLLSKGNGVCHSIESGVYRLNEYSTFGGKSDLEKIRQNYLVYEELYNYTGDKLMKQTAARCYVELYKNNYRTYGKPRNLIQYYALFWFRPVLSLKRSLKRILQRDF